MKDSKPVIKFIILISIIGGTFFATRYTALSEYTRKDTLVSLLEQLRGRWWGPLGFILIYGVGCVVAIPGSLLTLGGGAIFGVAWGTLYNIIASNLGATLAFFMARYFGRDFVSRFMKGRVESLDEKVAEHGFQFIFTLRLIPLIPFNGLNFGSGLSRIKYRDYLLGSALGMLPGTFIYTYFADALLKGITGSGRKAFINLAIASSLLILISFSPKIYKKFRKSTNNEMIQKKNEKE
ncbi:MAG: TVP38/TMEM64 family protein [Candidatus Loosdrechtia sp.]|uniref:TVP38/TMEM64 family protein n=1 Tax=Candidatus Loosdrechtia sp. TaxID=3101272 RepID=UPI003A678F3F|nr:MAG: TVP38/TMEM64 family protein [Candidatus Jettenia sp. AMX2]